jgi:hypothetical protein
MIKNEGDNKNYAKNMSVINLKKEESREKKTPKKTTQNGKIRKGKKETLQESHFTMCPPKKG